MEDDQDVFAQRVRSTSPMRSRRTIADWTPKPSEPKPGKGLQKAPRFIYESKPDFVQGVPPRRGPPFPATHQTPAAPARIAAGDAPGGRGLCVPAAATDRM